MDCVEIYVQSSPNGYRGYIFCIKESGELAIDCSTTWGNWIDLQLRGFRRATTKKTKESHLNVVVESILVRTFELEI